MTEIKIKDKFKSLIPPLAEDELILLEKSILEEGVRDPLVLWNDVLVDGHNRYAIAQKHGLQYKTVRKEFDSENSAIVWVISNQMGRLRLA